MLVSVIMPYFEKKKFVKEAIESVLAQSYQNFEIILIYDDNLDQDYEFIISLKKLDKRIKVLRNNQKLGAGMSRNKGIENSNGDYIAFLDSDDLWEKDKLTSQLEYMKKNNYDISFTSYKIINESGEIIGKRSAKNLITFEDLIKSCDVGLSTVVLKKNLINKDCNFPNLKTKEDFVLWLKITKNNINLKGLNLYLAKWRKLSNSLSSNTIQKLIDGFRVYNQYMGYNKLISIYYLFLLSINYLIKK